MPLDTLKYHPAGLAHDASLEDEVVEDENSDDEA